MSRDPLDSDATAPKTLHKYLYADGDPVNVMDPTGREGLVEYVTNLVKRVLPVVKPLYACGAAVYGLYKLIDSALDNEYNQPGHTYVPHWSIWAAVGGVLKTCGQQYVTTLVKSYF